MTASQSSTVAELLAAAIAGLSAEKLPPAMRAMADNLVLDVIGLCLAARGTDYVRAALDAIDGVGTCTAIGHAGPRDAAGAVAGPIPAPVS